MSWLSIGSIKEAFAQPNEYEVGGLKGFNGMGAEPSLMRTFGRLLEKPRSR